VKGKGIKRDGELSLQEAFLGGVMVALAIILLLAFMFQGAGAADAQVTDTGLVFEDTYSANGTDAYVILNTTDSHNITLNLTYRGGEGTVLWAILFTSNTTTTGFGTQTTTNDTIYVLFVDNGYYYVAVMDSAVVEGQYNFGFWRVWWVTTVESREYVSLGPANEGDNISVSIVNNDTVTIRVNSYSYTDSPQGAAYAEPHLALGSLYGDAYNDAMIMIDDVEFKKWNATDNLTLDIYENWTLYDGHYFADNETLIQNGTEWGVVVVKSPARVYAEEDFMNAPAQAPSYEFNLFVAIQSWFLEYWYIPFALIGFMIFVDTMIDIRDYVHDRRKKR
jgi:hypothetical protein